MFLERMKTTDFNDGEKHIFVVPTGSTEQHGPFLPLGTDSFVQDQIVLEAEKQMPKIIFLPTLRITCSEEHSGFAGSLWISLKTMKTIMYEICSSLQPYASKIVFITAHGGNVAVLQSFVKDHKNSFGTVQLQYVDLNTPESDERMVALLGGPIDAHAGNSEISMMLAIERSIVSIPPKDYPKKIIKGPFKTNRLRDFSENGIADNHPEWVVRKELGEAFIQLAADELVKELKKRLI